MNIKNILTTILVASIGGIIAVFAYSFFTKNYENKTITVPQTNSQFIKTSLPLSDQSGNIDFTFAAEKSINAVVHVKTQYMLADKYSYGNSFFDFFFGERSYTQPPRPVLGSGSGVIISENGYIVTNNHVIEKSDNIEVILNDKRTYSAKLVGTDPTTDIALLKIDEKNLPSITYGNSDELKIGEWVLAVGNPFNLTSTVTAGIVSAKARNINILSKNFAIESFIQTDAVVNHGNSGGALVNTKGELVGINTAIASNTGSFTGYSFAIPVNIVKKIVADIIEFGEVQRAFIGASIMNIDAKLAEKLGLDKIEGIYVAEVNEGGAAMHAGIKKNDIIIKIEDIFVNNVPELLEQISKYRPGDKINITVKRNNKTKQYLVTLRNKLGNTKIVKTEVISVLGGNFEDITSKEKHRLQLNYGVKIVELGAGKLKNAGIKEGFIITRINRKPVYKVDNIKYILKNINGGVLIEGVYPNGTFAYYAFGM